MNKEQQELLDEAYKNWKAKGRDFWEEQIDGMFTSELGEEKVDKISKEEFINKCKTDPEFSKKWGLKIEERELNLEERFEKFGLGMAVYDTVKEKEYWKTRLDETSTPTRLITITYNDKPIESYE
jgi:hypothetical protein